MRRDSRTEDGKPDGPRHESRDVSGRRVPAPAAYHPGERAVQARAGVLAMAEKIGRGIHDVISPPAREFLRQQRMAFLGTLDAAGGVWASALTGDPGFLDAFDERTLRIEAVPGAGDPLGANLHEGAAVGVLAIEFDTRRRIRVNGTATPGDGAIHVATRQVYANCPKYIQRRQLAPSAAAPGGGRLVSEGSALTRAWHAWVARADTFIIASAHPEAGADASHRGGNPGFVRIIDAATLVWPDYTGNMMFQTLGNIAANPATGLLFIDFERGATLQMTGRARIAWEGDVVAGGTSAERAVEFTIERVIHVEGSLPQGWSGAELSPHNPPTDRPLQR